MTCHSQNYSQVKFEISDIKGPLPGASVRIKDSSTETTTDINGKASLQIKNANPIIQISFFNLIEFELLKHTDLVVITLSDKSVINYYSKGKKIKRKKIKRVI